MCSNSAAYGMTAWKALLCGTSQFAKKHSKMKQPGMISKRWQAAGRALQQKLMRVEPSFQTILMICKQEYYMHKNATSMTVMLPIQVPQSI
jgi:hypothetical protein